MAISQSNYLSVALAKLKCQPYKAQRVRELLPSLLLRKTFTYTFWLFYLFKYQQHEDLGAADLAEDIRIRLKQKYRKLFILCRPPKEHLFEVLPFLFAIAIKEGLLELMPKAKGSWDEECDVELHDFVQKELSGYSMSLLSLHKNIDKFVTSQPDKAKKGLQSAYYSLDPKEQKGGKDRAKSRPSIRLGASTELREILSRSKGANESEAPVNSGHASQRQLPVLGSIAGLSSILASGRISRNEESLEGSSVMGSTRHGKFDTSSMSPVFEQFYSSSGFSSPLIKKKRMLKHIAHFEEQKVPGFQLEM